MKLSGHVDVRIHFHDLPACYTQAADWHRDIDGLLDTIKRLYNQTLSDRANDISIERLDMPVFSWIETHLTYDEYLTYVEQEVQK